MPRHRQFNELTRGFSEERKAKIATHLSELKRKMTAREVRASANSRSICPTSGARVRADKATIVHP